MVTIMENPIKMDDLGVPLFLETPTWMSQEVINWIHPGYKNLMVYNLLHTLVK